MTGVKEDLALLEGGRLRPSSNLQQPETVAMMEFTLSRRCVQQPRPTHACMHMHGLCGGVCACSRACVDVSACVRTDAAGCTLCKAARQFGRSMLRYCCAWVHERA
eukprot:366413-Chlamydomonas_euryale.AAC.9